MNDSGPRFDGGRAMALVADLAFPRRVDTDGSRRARELLVPRLREAGLEVEEDRFAFTGAIFREVPRAMKLVAAATLLAVALAPTWRPVQAVVVAAWAGAFLLAGCWTRLLVALWRRGLLRGSLEGVNLLGRAGPATARRAVVLMAHYDSISTAIPTWLALPISVGAAGAALTAVGGMAAAAWLGPSAPSWLPSLVHGCAVGGAAAFALFSLSSRGNASPGAQDNASGVAIALEVARGLAADLPPDAAVWCVLTDAEEVGLLGAVDFLTRRTALALEPGTVTLVLDMPVSPRCSPSLNVGFGFPRPRCTDRELNGLLRGAAAGAGLRLSSLYVPFFSALDHFPLVEAGARCAAVTTVDWNIHGPGDTLDRVPPGQVLAVGQACVEALAAYLRGGSARGALEGRGA